MINSAGDLVYVADDRSIVNGGGIQKWAFDGSSWSLQYTLGTGASSTVGARGITVDWSGVDPVIYATTGEGTSTPNRIIGITDMGAGSAATLLATAGSAQFFRGISYIPEPSSLALFGLMGAAWLLRRKTS